MAVAQPGAVTLLLIQTGTSCFMAGLMWTMQTLNYPLLSRIDPADVPRYEQAHNRRFIGLVGPGIAVTLASAVIMLAWRPRGIPLAVPLTALTLLIVIIASTARHGAPSHARLAQQFDPAVHALLVRTNWIRTAAWTAFGIMDLIALAHTLPA
jgi:hypothetical protein